MNPLQESWLIHIRLPSGYSKRHGEPNTLFFPRRARIFALQDSRPPVLRHRNPHHRAVEATLHSGRMESGPQCNMTPETCLPKAQVPQKPCAELEFDQRHQLAEEKADSNL